MQLCPGFSGVAVIYFIWIDDLDKPPNNLCVIFFVFQYIHYNNILCILTSKVN